jgi:thiamine-phosphate pyrophosphorylase
MFILKKKYFFIIESIKDIELKNIKNFGKFSIIYRNKIPENINKLKTFRLDCKSKKIPLLVANNINLMREVKADGLYISAHNKKLNLRNFKKNFDIIGGAHNIKEINIKKFQGCSEILLSRLFKTPYKNKKGFMGVVKFNLFSKLSKTSLTPLGGINLKNLNKLKNVNCESIALSSLIIDRPDQAQKVLK